MNVGGYSSSLIGTCGVNLWYSFAESFGYNDYRRSLGDLQFGGIGYNIAGFVNTRACKAAYKEIHENYKIVFQSPVKRNSNSGRKFFFIVFKRKGV